MCIDGKASAEEKLGGGGVQGVQPEQQRFLSNAWGQSPGGGEADLRQGRLP